ncbi:MAG: peptide chain release factor N(5)-glutamine methyltransferase, partial [Oscillospiraceae bacterium]|nr:peptide chain release factor N(5)-glutamine methyltransferase [Oscillospiraceae bacterium]
MKMTITKLLKMSYEKLSKSGIESYQLDSQIILANLLEKNRIYLHTNKFDEVSEKVADKFIELMDLRSTGYPLQYILGYCEFMGMQFRIEEGVLIPRQDTEILALICINKIHEENIKEICDVACGSGIIGISILKNSKCQSAHMFDISDKALELTEINAKKLGVVERSLIFKSDLLNHAIEHNIKYDLIVSNPPYIKTGEIKNLMKDV